jgi:hypothetical protein
MNMEQVSETENGTIQSQTPSQFSHSVKIEQTAKGARVTVHVNANNGLEAMEQSINLYRGTRLQLEQLEEVVAPMEIK